MKAHIARTPRIVLAWGLESDSTALAALEKAAGSLKMTVKPVSADNLTVTVASLCGLPQGHTTAKFTPGDDVFPAAAVFCGLSDRELDQMLGALKGVDIPLKAIVTPTSQNWELGALLSELCRERDAIAAQSGAEHSNS